MMSAQDPCQKVVLDDEMMKLVEAFGVDACQASLKRCSENRTNDHPDVQNLSSEKELTEAILDSSFDAIILSNPRGRISKVNRAALRLFGFKENEIVGQTIFVIVGGGEAPYHDEYFEKFRRRGMHSPHFGKLREVYAKRKDGSEFPCRVGIKKLPGSLTVGFIRDITKEKEAMEIAIEKRAAEELLMNILPEEVATRLKNDPSHIADHFTTATILFADIVGFTKMSSTMEAVNIVKFLNNLFSRFDERLDMYGLNKIKTIGDCYMVTSIPGGSKDPVRTCAAVCHFALDMLQVLETYNEDNPDTPINLRVGVDCGPVVAGVIGTKRFLYDVWGQPVNVASRMESTGIPGKIQVTKHVVDGVPQDEFDFDSRGTIQVKGVGEMETYFLDQRLKNRSANYWTLVKSTKPVKHCPRSISS